MVSGKNAIQKIKRLVGYPLRFFFMFFFDPRVVLVKWRAIPHFVRNLRRYSRLNKGTEFPVSLEDIWFQTFDMFQPAARVALHYFHQDVWAARWIYESGITLYVDVGSRIDGFVAQVLPFCKVIYVDLRRLDIRTDNLEFLQSSILELGFDSDSVASLSCLHVLEHVGLGRYGDIVDPESYLIAARELQRVLRHGGTLLLAVPVGREKLCFDAHRVFDPETVRLAFHSLEMAELSLIDDRGDFVRKNASFEQARRCSYGCGLFRFVKPDLQGNSNA